MSMSFPRCIVLLLSTALAACATAPTSLPKDFLGQWYYLGSSGGITGDGLGDPPTGYIVISGDSIVRHEEDGTAVGTVRFSVTRGPTIFSSEDAWILHPESGSPEVAAVTADGLRLTLSENVYDGIQRTYARSR